MELKKGIINMDTKKIVSLNQEQLAEMIGISVDTLNNYKKLTKLLEAMIHP